MDDRYWNSGFLMLFWEFTDKQREDKQYNSCGDGLELETLMKTHIL